LPLVHLWHFFMAAIFVQYICVQRDVNIVDAWAVMPTVHGAITCDSSRTIASQLTKILPVERSSKSACENKRFSTGGKQTELSAENVVVTGASEQLTTTVRTTYSRLLASKYSLRTVPVSDRARTGAKHRLKSTNYNAGWSKSAAARYNQPSWTNAVSHAGSHTNFYYNIRIFDNFTFSNQTLASGKSLSY